MLFSAQEEVDFLFKSIGLAPGDSTVGLHLGAAFGSFAVSLSVATFFVLIVAYFFPFPIANIVVAFSPGAQDTMMVLALALHLDPVYVAAHHVARFVVTAFSIAIAARAIAREAKR